MSIKNKNTLRALLLVPMFGLVVGLAPTVAADTHLTIKKGAGSAKGTGVNDCLVKSESIEGCESAETPLFQTITNVLLFIIGAISVIMLIIGGIRYTISNGDSGAITNAKNTILYAIIGIIVAILAFAIVNFVVGSF